MCAPCQTLYQTRLHDVHTVPDPVSDTVTWCAHRARPCVRHGYWCAHRTKPCFRHGYWWVHRARPCFRHGYWCAHRAKPCFRRAEPSVVCREGSGRPASSSGDTAISSPAVHPHPQPHRLGPDIWGVQRPAASLIQPVCEARRFAFFILLQWMRQSQTLLGQNHQHAW